MSLRKNTTLNLAGSLAPLAAALLTIPALLQLIGDVRFGVLALVWLLLGHFAVFDFGLSRATARRIARTSATDTVTTREVFWTSLWLNLSLGVLGGIVLAVLAGPLMTHVFEVSDAVRAEVLAAVAWIASAVPLATVTGVLVGALDGRERFEVSNGLQAIGAILVQVAPVIAAYAIATDLNTLIAAAVAARAWTVLALLIANLRLVAPGRPLLVHRSHAHELLSYGMWIAVSSLIVPFFMSLDKFMVGAVLGAAAVAYYSVADQLVRRISMLPAAVMRTLFPRLAAAAEVDSHTLSLRSARVLNSIVTPAVTLLIVSMYWFFSIWIDEEFARRATAPGIVLAAGIWLNSLAAVPSSALLAAGRPDLTAKAHLIEIAPHVVMLWGLVHVFGLIGAAVAILLVTILDSALLMRFANINLCRMQGFWAAVGWILIAGGVGLSAASMGAWFVPVALSIALGSTLWGFRTSPEIGAAITALWTTVAAPRRSS